MCRFEDLLSRYEEGGLSARERAELAEYVDRDPDCRDAFLEAVSEQRIRRIALQNH